jgi:hypothetical protein
MYQSVDSASLFRHSRVVREAELAEVLDELGFPTEGDFFCFSSKKLTLGILVYKFKFGAPFDGGHGVRRLRQPGPTAATGSLVIWRTSLKFNCGARLTRVRGSFDPVCALARFARF